MSSSDRDLEATLAKSGHGHQPPYAWQEQVWRQIEEPALAAEPPKRSGFTLWALVTVATVLLVAGTGALLVVNHMSDLDERQRVAMDMQLKRQIEWEQEVELTQMEIDVFQQEMDQAFINLEAAQDDEAKQRAIAARDSAKANLVAARDRLERLQNEANAKQAKSKKVRAKKKEKSMISKCAKSNDPLCGL